MKLGSLLCSVVTSLALSAPALAVTAGIDFNVAGGTPSQTVTESGFLGVPATAAKNYNVTHNGINFDIQTINANNANQNRYRGAGASQSLNNLTPVTVDFIQWYGTNQPGGVEATITMTGLLPERDYELSFYMYNAGAGQTTHVFYEGISSALGSLISSFTTAGNQNTPATWIPNFDTVLESDSTGKIVVTILAPQFTNGSNIDSRLTFDGMSITLLPIPEPATASLALLGLGGLVLRRRHQA